MPFRCALSPSITALPRQCLLHLCQHTTLSSCGGPRRQLHNTASLRDEQIDNSTNHYETLKLHPGATPADIKKSFYSLSKTHHPDHNPSNPHAARRFMRISEAYSILSIPAKRSAYDRDTLRLHASHGHGHGHGHGHHGGHHGSYSSTGPAGGRPASGLSRRRGTFQGPPPSFFRSGGWGAQSAKRRAAHDESTGGSSHSSSSAGTDSQQSAKGTGTGTAGGMGPGQDPFGHGAEVPHFDRASHERTGRNIDRRRAARQQVDGEHISVEPERGMAGMFFVIGGVLVLSILGPFAIDRAWKGSSGNDQERKGKGKKTSVTY
ncbi:DnaJ-domain-containing protein [Hypoxylon cercidicola]|nr:DnaJ-domain-containing protein [Hypoxylon cercidicola]